MLAPATPGRVIAVAPIAFFVGPATAAFGTGLPTALVAAPPIAAFGVTPIAFGWIPIAFLSMSRAAPGLRAGRRSPEFAWRLITALFTLTAFLGRRSGSAMRVSIGFTSIPLSFAPERAPPPV